MNYKKKTVSLTGKTQLCGLLENPKFDNLPDMQSPFFDPSLDLLQAHLSCPCVSYTIAKNHFSKLLT